MTLQQLRYFVDVAHTGSISRSAVNLYTSQPNLSSMIAQFEEELGVQLFARTNRGVFLTNDGIEFLSYAQKIVADAEHLETLYTERRKRAVSFRVAWTTSSPVSAMVCRYLNRIETGVPVSISLLESNQIDVIDAVCKNQADGGKLIIPEDYLELYESYCKGQGLILHKLWTIKTCLIVSAYSKLAAVETVDPQMITDDMIEIIYGPNGIYDLPNSTQRIHHGKLPERRIFFNDRGNLMDILTLCPNTFVRAAPITQDLLQKYNLSMRHYTGEKSRVIEAVVYPNRPLGKEAKLLISALEEMRDPKHPRWVEGFGPEPAPG